MKLSTLRAIDEMLSEKVKIAEMLRKHSHLKYWEAKENGEISMGELHKLKDEYDKALENYDIIKAVYDDFILTDWKC